MLLRAVGGGDFPAIEEGIHDPDVIRWIGAQPASVRQVLEQDAAYWAAGSPTLVICEPDGTCVGKIWLSVSDADRSTASIGYWLLPAGRGRGLATHAVRLLADWAARELGISNLRITTAPDNPRSQRVAERSGVRRVSPPGGEPPDSANAGQVVFERTSDQG